MKLNKIFLLLLLSLLFVGLSYATEVSNDDTVDTATVGTSTPEEAVHSSNTEIKEVDNTITDQTNKKEITKQNNTKNVKTESKTIDVNDFDTLKNALTSDTYDTLTLNIESNIKLTDNTELNEAIKTLTINGNGKTINGNNQYRFLYIESDSKVTLKNIKITNCYGDYGGVIDNNMGNVTIKNSVLNNNKAIWGGAIYTTSGSLTVLNTNLSNNFASNGGAITNEYAMCTLTNCTFDKNNASLDGGAIYNDETEIEITNTIFKNNGANTSYEQIYDYAEGAAIYNENSNLKVVNSTFDNNIGYYDIIDNNEKSKLTMINTVLKNHYDLASGTIRNSGMLIISNSSIYNNNRGIENYGSLSITNSFLYNNNAMYSGGAIYNNGHLKITNSILKNNTAYWGGAIYSFYNATVFNNTFIDNYANMNGSAIYNNREIIITNNTFKKNKANTTGNAIINIGKANINNNINDKISIYCSTIYNEGTATISKNLFDDELINTKITINKIPNTQYTNNVTIKGTLKTSSGTPLKSVTLTVNVNGKKVGTTKTNSKGIYTYKYTTKTPGKNNVTVAFAGNTNYAGATAKTTFKVTPKTTKITLNKIANTQYTNNATIKGTLKTSSGTVLKSIKLTVNINGKKYTATTNSKGIFTLKYTTKTPGKNNVTVAFAGNTKYSKATAKTTFKVTPKATRITITKIAKTKLGKTVTITGVFTDKNGNKIKNTKLTVKVNGKKYTATTNKAGKYTLKYKTTKTGTNNITVSYASTSKYAKSSASRTFVVVK